MRTRDELAMALVPIALLVLTVAVLLDRGIGVAAVNQPLDVTINTIATLAAMAVAALGWVHWREGRDAAALLRASAFGVLGAVNAILLAAVVAGRAPSFGLDPSDPGQLPILATVVSRSVAGVLLVAAGVAGMRTSTVGERAAQVVLWLPAAAVVLAVAGMAAIQPSLPALLGANELASLRASPTAPLVVFGARGLVAVQFVIGLTYLAAALLAYRSWRRGGRVLDAYLSVGLVIAAFSQVHFAIHPGTYASLVTVGDLMRLVFYLVMLVALIAESRDDVRALRRANGELRVLREVDLARATAEERARLAREIHDGMSQELWLARLKQGRLIAMDLGADERAVATEVADALDSAFSEARQAILALRPAEGSTFTEVLERFVADFSDRFGIRTELEADPAAETLGARAQAELLRIAQEAMTNAHRHADATRVRLSIERADGELRLTVSDNGRGFDASVPAVGRYGLGSMRERAELIGGSLSIESGPGEGTRIVVALPASTGR